jgi:hypothetical protein
MGMGFLASISAENAHEIPLGEVRDPIARFTAAAAELGLIRPGDKLDRNVIDLCLRVVEMAAEIGDSCPIRGGMGATAGDHIRAELCE